MTRPIEGTRLREGEVVYPEFLFLDFDRTLADLTKIKAGFLAASQKAGIDTAIIENEWMKAEEHGNSFNPLRFFEANYESKSRFIITFREFKHSDFLYPDAVRLLNRINDNDLHYRILTTAVKDGEEWQGLKVKTCGLEPYAYILNTPFKGHVIAGSMRPQGGFRIDSVGRIIAEKAVLVDDNFMAFYGMPSGCRGFYLKRDNGAKKQTGEVPPGVSVIKNLDELVIKNGSISLRKKGVNGKLLLR